MGEDKDNEFMSSAVVAQVINDLNESRRSEERRIKCSTCGTSFLRTLEDQAKCPKCQSIVPPEEVDDADTESD